ncbi:MAG TPA: response regulator transcription factor [Terriglobia bacterium]|nr:response regulator transcription factor [Terriglobia bacterium]
MRGGNHKEPLLVCFIEQNPLALEYMTALVQKDPSLRTVSLEILRARGDRDSPSAIFVVDNCGLPLPLSECLRRLRTYFTEAKCVILDRELCKEDMLRLLWIKIDGFLSYGEVPRSFLAAIHSVAVGKVWIPREILREYVQCAHEARLKNSSRFDGMTACESQIFELVKRRLSNKEIADIVRVQESTVKFHLSNIYSKLQISSRHDIIRGESKPSLLEQFPSALTPSTSKA